MCSVVLYYSSYILYELYHSFTVFDYQPQVQHQVFRKYDHYATLIRLISVCAYFFLSIFCSVSFYLTGVSQTGHTNAYAPIATISRNKMATKSIRVLSSKRNTENFGRKRRTARTGRISIVYRVGMGAIPAWMTVHVLLRMIRYCELLYWRCSHCLLSSLCYY